MEVERSHIGPYRIVRQIGAGGMGVVYEATHESIERRVAIKVLHSEFSSNREIATRFFNEARAANIIRHPGVVSISEFGQTPDGAAYLVMEYLEGETLRQRLARGPMGFALTRLGGQLAAALAAAHARGVIHRDLKPDNVMIISDPDVAGGERIKILDFGIAKLADAGGADRTRTDVVMGTPTYMAPEQCRGAAQVDAQADVYALGVIFYHMVAGQPPFVAEGHGAVMAMHMYDRPRPLGAMLQQAWPDLTDLIDQMLAKEPAQRPTSAQVATRMQGFRRADVLTLKPNSSSFPVTEGPVLSTLGAAAGQQRRPLPRPVYSAAAAALTLSLVGAGALLLRPARPVDPAPPIAAPSTPSAQPSAATSQGPAPRPEAAPRRAAGAPVRWSLDSDPPGADVLRASDNALLGQTPLRIERERGAGLEVIILRRRGYADRRVSLPLSADWSRSEKLRRLAAPPRTEDPSPHAPQKKHFVD